MTSVSCGNKSHDAIKTYEGVVVSYKSHNQCLNQMEIDYFKGMPSLDEAIEKAAKALDENGKMYDHQYRVGAERLNEFYKKLICHKNQIAKANDFDDLIGIANGVAAGIYRVGELTAYDTAVRIGAYLDLLPSKIYLHAGVKKAATYMGLGRGKEYIEVAELPGEFAQLEPYQIENLMCTCRRSIQEIVNRQSAN